MKKFFLLMLALTLFSVNAESNLAKLIQQNIKDSDKSYKQTILPISQRSKSLRLWIHIRSKAQRNVAKKIYKAISGTQIEGSHIVKKPLQIITFGPKESQLRYFKKNDKSKAVKLFKILHKVIPTLKLKDLSGEYSHVRWIKKGHLELWLSPKLIK